jgi:import inner membrane translocase subunit TIM54
MSTPTPTPPVEPPVTPSAAELPTPKTVPTGTAAKAPLPAHLSALEHTGIPRSVLTWKPRLPSRNWTIFLTIVGSLSYLYYDDRKQCKELKQSYLDKVRHLSEQPMENSLGQPRRVKVYSARWPEDDDAERGMKHFRRYVKVSGHH